MRWFWLSCPQCEWKSKQPVTEDVKNQFTAMKYCQECKEKRRPRSEYVVREVITNTRRV